MQCPDGIQSAVHYKPRCIRSGKKRLLENEDQRLLV